jgi:hypothetical protein
MRGGRNKDEGGAGTEFTYALVASIRMRPCQSIPESIHHTAISASMRHSVSLNGLYIQWLGL